MSENNLKSAWEIALEKLEAQGEGPIEELSEKIKKKIGISSIILQKMLNGLQV